MKDQFQSTETLRVRFLPFVNKLTGEYIIGSDTCQLTLKKPDNTTSSVAATFDSDVSMWYYDVLVGSYQQGEWRIKAVSNDTNALPQWKVYIWGDYVEDITTVKTRLGTPVAASISADIANVQTTANTVNTTANTINTKIGTPVSSVSTDIAGVQTTSNTINTKIGTPDNGTVSQDILDLRGVANSIDSNFPATLTQATLAAASAASADTYAQQAATNSFNGLSYSVDIFNNLGTPVSTTISADIANVQTAANTAATQSTTAATQATTAATQATTAATQSTIAATQSTTAATQATTAATQATTAATQSTSAATYSLICRKVLTNRWKVDSAAKKFYIYDDDETTIIAEFDLLDSAGAPTATSIFERDPI
jgi:hypothetical protein